MEIVVYGDILKYYDKGFLLGWTGGVALAAACSLLTGLLMYKKYSRV